MAINLPLTNHCGAVTAGTKEVFPGSLEALVFVIKFIFLTREVHLECGYAQRRATKLILKLPFRCDVTYKTRLQLANLLPISYWYEFLDIIFFYKAVNNLVFIDSEVLPVTRQSTRSTRSSSTNSITYIPKRGRTVTYQRSFFIRACRTWNVLPAELRTSHTSLASFKHSLLQYYFKALDLYDTDDIRTRRTICPRCNIARTLLCTPTCCF